MTFAASTQMVASLAPRRRAVFVSDVHLGSKHCHAAEFADFLAALRCDRLYLVGDIVDLWWMAQRRATWNGAHNRVVEVLHALRRDGTELIYVPGNHDRPVRRFCGLVLPRMAIRRRAIHVTADGRRLLVTHGDDYDAATHFGGMQERFGDWLYYRILTGNRLLNFARRRCGLRYWSLALYLKHRIKNAVSYISDFERAVAHEARRRGVDGVVCGHIHKAEIRAIDGVLYCNDGDWVESLTALVETDAGELRIVDWREIAERARHAAMLQATTREEPLAYPAGD